MLSSDEYKERVEQYMDKLEKLENEEEAKKTGAEYHHEEYEAFKR